MGRWWVGWDHPTGLWLDPSNNLGVLGLQISLDGTPGYDTRTILIKMCCQIIVSLLSSLATALVVCEFPYISTRKSFVKWTDNQSVAQQISADYLTAFALQLKVFTVHCKMTFTGFPLLMQCNDLWGHQRILKCKWLMFRWVTACICLSKADVLINSKIIQPVM